MVQFYFLSVFFNLIGGFSLVLASMPLRSASIEGFRTFLRSPTVSLVIGILSLVTGAFKLLTVIRGDIPVVGDFLPAVGGMSVGATLILEHFRDPARLPTEARPESAEARAEAPPASPRVTGIERLLLDHKTAVGLAGMISGGLHFLFPMVIFL